MLVGEAPGYRSWANGRRWTGPAGLLLRRALDRLEHPRYRDLEDVFYMTDAVKCHPSVPASTTNRSPRPCEITACFGHLVRELEVLRPSVIVTIGKTAAKQVSQAIEVTYGQEEQLPTVIPLPHPSPRNLVTIRRSYPSLRAFETAVARIFRRLILLREARDAHA
ncbi:uracil-DNA glycosylase family protein [Candidatus Nitrospira bockiana]